MNPLFSIVLIARNEAKTLPRLIDSLTDFKNKGGEICLLDTGSTDDTAEIARSLGCKVHEVGTKFLRTIDKQLAKAINKKFMVNGEADVVAPGDTLFDYASARNYIADFASNDMIATPDCDEIWTKLDIDHIDSCIKAGAEQFEYNFVFAHDTNGNPLVQFMHSKFYNRKKLKWSGIIHEVLQGEANRVFLDESIAKLEHFQNVETNRSGYLKGLAYDCYFNPSKDRQSHYFARELMYYGKFKSAIKEFRNHIAMNKWQTERAQSMLFMGDCYSAMADIDNAMFWYIKSFDLEPNRREPLMRLADIGYSTNKPIQVIAYCEAALKLNGVNFYANYEPYYSYYPHELLYWAYWWIGDKVSSKLHFDIAFGISPTNPKYIEEKKFYYPELDFTGERVVPGKMDERPDVLKEHIARYEFASQFTEGKTVLDAACGTGYGKNILKAGNYIGLDNSEAAIDFAKENFGDGYFLQDLEQGVQGHSVDIIISFETIEHLENPDKFLRWASENSEFFIFSIPVNMPSEFHKQVYSTDEIKGLMNKYFGSVIYFNQDEFGISEFAQSKYIIGIAAKKLPSVNFVIPQLGREAGLLKCINSIHGLNYPSELIKVSVIEGDETVPEKVHNAVSENSSDYICYAANDMFFEPNSLLAAIIDSITLKMGLVSFNEGPLLQDNGNICTHFIIRKDLIGAIGQIFDTRFQHAGCDNLLWAKCKKLGQAHRSENAIIVHNHFSKGSDFDSVYQKGWSNVKQDRELLQVEIERL